MNHIQKTHIILYVEDQQRSTEFYETIFRTKATLNVPGMTEFEIHNSLTMGLMPNDGMAKILKDKTPHPKTGTGIPRCELYLYVEDIKEELENISKLNIELISKLQERNWGDEALYFADPDGHIIAFAKKLSTKIL